MDLGTASRLRGDENGRQPHQTVGGSRLGRRSSANRWREPTHQARIPCGEDFLQMFEFPLLTGQETQVMADPRSIVITEATAKALFGDEDPINKVVRADNEHDLKVTGVLRNVPANSSFQFDFLMTWKFHEQAEGWVRENTTNWGNYSFQVFVELDDPAHQAAVESRIKMMLQEHGEKDTKPELYIYPMLRWRLYASFDNGVESGGTVSHSTYY